MRLVPSLTLAFGLLALSGCGKEAGRVAFAAEGASESTLPLKAGEVSFWTDIDVEFEGSVALAYKIELHQNGAPVGTTVCNPLGDLPMKTGWVSTDLGSSHSRRGNGKMRCDVQLATAGATKVKASLAFNPKPAKFTLKKADLVIKQ